MSLRTDRSTFLRVAANVLAIVLLVAVLPGAFAFADGADAQVEASSTEAPTEVVETQTEATQTEAAQPQPSADVTATEPAEGVVTTTTSDGDGGSGQGASTSGPYDSTSDGSPSGNGNGDGKAVGKPCAGCVGDADDKNPPGQMPNAEQDGDKGYECDDNSGVGKTNPAHSGCKTTPPGPDPAPAIRLDKSGPNTAKIGDTITYTFVVTNTGDETLTNVRITDPLLGDTISVTPSTLPPESDGIIVRGGASADLTILASHVKGGKVENTATAHGTGQESGRQVKHSDSHTVKVATVTPKHPKHTFCHATGQPDKFVILTLPVPELLNGHFGSHHHDARDIIPPFDHDGDPATADISQNWDAAGQRLFADGCVVAPAIDLEKTGPATARVGETITYKFKVTNTGNRPLSNVHITDPLIGGGAITVADGTLGIGETEPATATYTVRAEDLNDDSEVPNTATVFGTDPDGDVVTAQSSWVVTVPIMPPTLLPEIELTKTGPDSARVGDRITYEFEVTNTGDVPLTNVHITDPLIGAGDITVTPATLPVGETGEAFAEYTVREDDVNDDGEVPNTATVFGTDARDGTVVTDQASWVVLISALPPGGVPGIDLEKDGPATAREGDRITYSFTVTNTGGVTLTDVHVTDPLLGGRIEVTPSTLTTTGPNRIGRATATYTITAADATAGEVLNTAIATGTSPTGDVHAEDNHRVEVPVIAPAPEPGIELIKSGPRHARVGDTITYRFRVTNTGTTVLSNVTVTDAKLGLSDLPVTPSTLAPGRSGTASATYTVTPADGRRGFVYNTAVAGGTPPQGPRVTDDDDHRTNVPAVPPGPPPVVPPSVPPGPPLPATGVDAALQLLAAGLALILGFGLVRLTARTPQPASGAWSVQLDGSSSRRLSGAASPPRVHHRPGRPGTGFGAPA